MSETHSGDKVLKAYGVGSLHLIMRYEIVLSTRELPV